MDTWAVDTLLSRQCLTCPSTPPTCNCTAQQQCQAVSASCTTCSQTFCVPLVSSSSSSSGVSPGALAAAVLAVLLLLALALALFFYLRRRSAARRATARRSTPLPEKTLPVGPPPPVPERPPSARVSPHNSRNPFADQTSAADSAVSYLSPPHDPLAAQAPPHPLDQSLQNHPYATAGGAPLPPYASPPARPARSPELTLRPPDPLGSPNRASMMSTGTSMISDSESAVIYDARTQTATRHFIGAPARALVVPLNSAQANLSFPRSPLGQAPLSVEDAMPPIGDPFADSASNRYSGSTMATYYPDDVQIMNVTRTPISDLGSAGPSSRTGSLGRPSIVNLRPQAPGMPTLLEYQTAIGQAAARPPPPLSSGHVRRASAATMATTASGFSTSSSLLSSFPFVPPSPISANHSHSPLSMNFSLRDGGDESDSSSGSRQPVPLVPQSRPVSNWSTASGLSAIPAHPPLPLNVPPVPSMPAGYPRRALSTATVRTTASGASSLTTGSILSAFPFHIPPSTGGSILPMSPLPSSAGLPDHGAGGIGESPMPVGEGYRNGPRASLDSAILSRQVGELDALDAGGE